MASLTCDINTFILTIVVILIVSFTDTIFINVPILKKLFTDSLNFTLIIALVILVILIDIPRGVILAFIILYLSVYVNYNSSKKVRFADVKTVINTYPNYTNSSNYINSSNSNVLSESEFIYDNSKPFPNNNIPPFAPLSQDDINKMSSNKEVLGCGMKTSTDPDYITKVDSPSRDGYDITGCRYDFKNSPQNTTMYGPPLAQCATYSGEQAKTCGTVFYPLNA